MTIPQRLREIAVRLRKPRDGRPWGADDGAADLLYAIAAELEAPAADAQKVVILWRDHLPDGRYDPNAKNEPLIRQHDHLAAVAALQARINALEARQVPSSAEDEFAVVWPDGGRFVANTLESARNYMSGAVPSCAERGVEPPVIVRYVPADTVPYEPQQDSSKEQP